MITLDKIKQNRDKIQQISTQYHAENVRVFGSVARGDSSNSSDIDFLVRFLSNATLFDQVGLPEELSALFSCKVDVVSERALNPLISSQIFDEAVLL